MTTKLNQIIAVEKGIKAQTARTTTDIYHLFQKDLTNGLARSYNRLDEEGEILPDESTRVQVKVREQLDRASAAFTELFNVTFTKDAGNCMARGDIVIDDETILADVPVTTLLFLEKQLVDIHTFVKKIPVLSAAEEWKWDAANQVYRTNPTKSFRTKKIMRNHVKAQATDKFPAQVETYHEDKNIGEWMTTKFSGAFPAADVQKMLERVESLQRAVKFAREKANSTEITQYKVAGALTKFIFG